MGWLLGIFLGASLAKGSVFGTFFFTMASFFYLLWRILK